MQQTVYFEFLTMHQQKGWYILTLPLIIINNHLMFLFDLATGTVKEKYIVGQDFIYL